MPPAGLGIVKSDDFTNPTEPAWSSHEVESFPEKLEIIWQVKEFPVLLKVRRRRHLPACVCVCVCVCLCILIM